MPATETPKRVDIPQRSQGFQSSPLHEAAPNMRETNGESQKIRISAGGSGNVTPQKRDSSTISGSSRRPTPRAEETPETWEDRTLSAIFRITLDEHVTRDAHGHPLHYAGALRQELEDQSDPIRLRTSELEQGLLEVGPNLGKTKPLDYLLACWKRVSRLNRSFKKPAPEDPKYVVVQEARRMCMSYCIFAITTPELFGLEPYPSNPLSDHLLLDSEDDRGICHDFLTEAVARFDEDESIKEALVGAVEELSRRLSVKSMDSDYQSYTPVRNPSVLRPLTS